ncbi:MAG: ABC transporter permease [Hydrotalea sp.]|nr:ABC transporter permease [Hydrotalea sp.]
MQPAFHIARKITFNRQPSFSRFIIRLSVIATSISVAAMILTLCFVNGFQDAISKKIFGFWGHIRIQPYTLNKSLIAEDELATSNDTILLQLKQFPQITSVNSYITRSAVIEKNGEIEGCLLKGIDPSFPTKQFEHFIKLGHTIAFEDSMYDRSLVISELLANKLQLALNDTVKLHFIKTETGTSTYRKLRVAGIYKTGLEEYDQLFCLVDIRLLQRIISPYIAYISGYEVFTNTSVKSEDLSLAINETISSEWLARSMESIFPNIFDWLEIQNVNRNVVFIIMGVVALINLLTCLLVLVLERTRMVGILKALGGEDKFIQQIFLYYASFIALRGVGIGAIIGLLICWLQLVTGFIQLDETAYYVSVAPVVIVAWQIALVVLATFLVAFLSLWLPTFLIRKIQPIQAIQFN